MKKAGLKWVKGGDGTGKAGMWGMLGKPFMILEPDDDYDRDLYEKSPYQKDGRLMHVQTTRILSTCPERRGPRVASGNWANACTHPTTLQSTLAPLHPRHPLTHSGAASNEHR